MHYAIKPSYRIIDSHIHVDKYAQAFQEQFSQEVNEGKYGITGCITVSMDIDSSKKNLVIAQKNEAIRPAFGYHPEQALPTEQETEQLLSFMEQHADVMVAVGEVGLPYYTRREQPQIPYDSYINLLEQFVRQAVYLEKPIILHAVYEDACIALDLLEKHSVERAHFHWFKGHPKVIDRIIQNKYVLSVTPDVCYEREIQQLVQAVPMELLLVETDGPWPFEQQFSQEVTHPKMIQASIEQIALLKRLPVEEVAQQIYQNTIQFYGL